MSVEVPSPQLTPIELVEPSGSLLEKVAVTVAPVLAGFGETLVKLVEGGLSFTLALVEADPDPPAFVAVTSIVKV